MQVQCPQCQRPIVVDPGSVDVDRERGRVRVRPNNILYCYYCKDYTLKGGDISPLHSGASYTASVQGGGAIAQGAGAVAVGRDAIHISGNGNVVGNHNRTNVQTDRGIPTSTPSMLPPGVKLVSAKGRNIYSWGKHDKHVFEVKGTNFRYTVQLGDKRIEV